LSACQTAVTDIVNAPDEAIGLPAGFLQAGIPGVIGTLWSVLDLSTMLLMTQFYQHMSKNAPVALALKQAQIWLRDASKNDVLKQLSKIEQRWRNQKDKDNSSSAQWKSIRRGMSQIHKMGERPFASPYYWAGFQAVGAVL